MDDYKFRCSRCGSGIQHADDPIVIVALNELYKNAEFAICRDCMTQEEKERALDVIVQKLVDYYASQGMEASIRIGQGGRQRSNQL